jgi:glycosyltransferase involved in cell wall biosynthesis
MRREVDPLSILHVTQAAPVGGLERVVHALALGQHRRGHEVRVAAVAGEGAPRLFGRPLEEAGVPVDWIEVTTYSVLSERRHLRELCRRHRPDIVHTHGYRPDIVDGPVARRLGIPIVSTEHGTGWAKRRGAIYGRLQLRSLRAFDAVVAVSRPIADLLERSGVPRDRIFTIYNAWADSVTFTSRSQAREELGLPGDAFVAGWVGRLIEAKGCDLFLRAVADVEDERLVAAIIGDGPWGSEVRQLARSLDLGDGVSLLGQVPDAARFFRAFDLFVMSSRTEGSPIVLLEAMAAGVPVIATRVGGLPDMVTSDEVSLVPPEDPSALAGALRAALKDYEPFAARARRARERLASDWALEPWLDQYAEIYGTVMRGRSRP